METLNPLMGIRVNITHYENSKPAQKGSSLQGLGFGVLRSRV